MAENTASFVATVNFDLSESAFQSSSLNLPSPAPWFSNVQRRLAHSIGPNSHELSDGKWLSAAVISAANRFFSATSDLFPTEPYLQSSKQGNLVAEFRGGFGAVTVVVSDSYATAMATVGDDMVQHKMQLNGARPSLWRSEVAKLRETLNKTHHGEMDPARR